MVDRSKINGDNSRKHGLSQDVLYDVWRRIMKDPFEQICDRWTDPHDYAGLKAFVADVRREIRDPPSKEHWLTTRSRLDPELKPGNIWWHERSVKLTKRKRREIDAKIRRGEMAAGVPDPVPCVCVLTEEACSTTPCACPWSSRIDCGCCVGVRTRLGLCDDPEPEDT